MIRRDGELQHEVFDHDWTATAVPTIAEFEEALAREQNPNKSAAELPCDLSSGDDAKDEDVGDPAPNKRMIANAIDKNLHIKVLDHDDMPFQGDRLKRYQFLFSYDGKTVWSYAANNGPVGTLIRAVHDGRVAIV